MRFLMPVTLMLSSLVFAAPNVAQEPGEVSKSCAQNSAGKPNPKAPPKAPQQVSEYAFLIGCWDVQVTIFQKDKPPFHYQARWNNRWIIDGYAVMQEWQGPYSSGAEIRTYHPKKNHWEGKNIYFPSPGSWYENTSKMVDGNMVVMTHQTDAAGTAVLARETYHDIEADSFNFTSEVSHDNGKTWQQGSYKATSVRVQP